MRQNEFICFTCGRRNNTKGHVFVNDEDIFIRRTPNNRHQITAQCNHCGQNLYKMISEDKFQSMKQKGYPVIR